MALVFNFIQFQFCWDALNQRRCGTHVHWSWLSTSVPWGLHCPGLCLYGPKHQGADFLHFLGSQKTCNMCNSVTFSYTSNSINAVATKTMSWPSHRDSARCRLGTFLFRDLIHRSRLVFSLMIRWLIGRWTQLQPIWPCVLPALGSPSQPMGKLA